MDKKPILKNIIKFSNIKLANGVDLSTLHSVSRQHDKNGKLGISTKSYGTKWFVLPDKTKALFKSFDIGYNAEMRKLRITNEILCYYLAQQINMPCAKYEPAHLYEEIGLISYNFLQAGETLKTLDEFLNADGSLFRSNLNDTLKALEGYKNLGYIYDKREIINNLFKIIVFDTITLQTDRHSHNIQFIFNKKTSEIKIAPAFDNEFAFSIDLIHNMYINPFTNTDDKTIDDVRLSYSKYGKCFTVLEMIKPATNAFNNNISNICAMAKADKQLGEILNTIINNINPKKAFAKLEKENYSISNEYKEFVSIIIKENINSIKKALEKVDLEDLEFFQEELIN